MALERERLCPVPKWDHNIARVIINPFRFLCNLRHAKSATNVVKWDTHCISAIGSQNLFTDTSSKRRKNSLVARETYGMESECNL